MTGAAGHAKRWLDRGAWLELGGRVLRARFDDGRGLPPSERKLELVGTALAWFATLFIGVIGLWEIRGPFGAGHYAASTAVAVGGENMWRFETLAPLITYLSGKPASTDFYCHHPFGVFWTAAVFFRWFGHHEWVVRLPMVLMSTAMPRLIFGAGRAIYGPIAGGLAAIGYVVVPITLAYSSFLALEGPTMFGMALATYGYSRFIQSERARFGVVALLGFGYAAACDWPGFVFGGLVLAGLFLRGFVLRRFAPLAAFERFATFWASLVVTLGAVALLHLALLVKLDAVAELLRSGEFRALGSDLPLSAVLDQRHYWITLAFTPIVIVLGKVAAPLFVLRLLAGRRELELFPLAVLATATLQYVVFKQGADIHFFWPQYFALYFAYAVGALFAALEKWSIWALARRRKLEPTHSEILWSARSAAVPWLLGAAGLGTLLAVVPDALGSAVYARKSGGRFNEKGLIIQPDFDKVSALEVAARTTPKDGTFGMAVSMKPGYWIDWVMQRPVRVLGLPRVGSAGVNPFAIDTRFDTRGAIESLTREFSVRAIGPFLVADTEALATPVEGFALVPRRLGSFERFFTATTHDSYDVVRDPFYTWELRNLLNQVPNPEPSGEPARPDQLRVAYNLAVWNRDGERAGNLRALLLRGVDTRAARGFSGGVQYLGHRLERGDSLRLTLYFETRTPFPSDVQFRVTSHVEAAPRYSLVPADELPWDVGMPFGIPTSLWRPGFVYTSVTELVRRPGRERYDGEFRGTQAPQPLEPAASSTLLTLD